MSKALERKLTPQQLERVRADFKRYDANGDGALLHAGGSQEVVE
ncbi:hypothetical protein [Pseudomonas extremorientalis]|uniref:EF-hand domain-containing protein n=1 Tax=Pseudomonas extremorientalis TaxID=169669 RepID=A0ABY0SE63_9PSED|nr:hypothetical protein [Pseudomonas extremorientalis]WLG55874.1 hypothetical protein PSH77_24935 [Pseudomonas extremorientalis]SDP14030.1 hypothetical protein SAMN04490184_2407 [Pseudomonas extremorientalis]